MQNKFIIKCNLARKLEEIPNKINGSIFQIALKYPQDLASKKPSAQESQKTPKKSVGRPRKDLVLQHSLCEVVDEQQLNQLMRWIHQDDNITISAGYSFKKNKNSWMLAKKGQTRITMKRQKGYKKNMACPLVHLLVLGPKGYTTATLTDMILKVMQSRNNQDSQQKMRRRVYQFLMVMRTAGIVYSQDDKISPFCKKTVELIQEVFPDYFNFLSKSQKQQYCQRIQNLNLSEQTVEQKKKRYNTKKSIHIEKFLLTPALRVKHLSWLKQRINQKNQLLDMLKKFKSGLKEGNLKQNNHLYLVGANNQGKQKYFKLDWVFPAEDLSFGIGFIENEYLQKGDILLSVKRSNESKKTNRRGQGQLSSISENIEIKEEEPQISDIQEGSDQKYAG